jgi:protein-S-isoprenylcysteine O-methyltransferase Ste14
MQWFNFQLGWLNLWILALIIFATPVLLNRIRGTRGKQGLARATKLPPMSQGERIAYMLIMAPQFLLPLYAIFVPFTAHAGLLGAGLIVFAIGQAIRLKSIWDYTTAPSGQLITHGVYQLSRNPGYFGATLTYVGMGLAGGSWFILLVALTWFLGYQWVASIEERFCASQWPEAFARYKANVAKNFIFF